MYDKGRIIAGVVIFLILLTSPLIYLSASGEGGYVPEPVIVTEEEQCVESVEYMTKKHMELLEDWKEGVVRGGTRTYVASDGKEYDVSLVETCLDCHTNKAEFCDQCHDYVGAKPSCWDCHQAPEE